MNADQAKELEQLILWKELVKELDDIIAMETRKLMFCSPEELVGLQQRILSMQKLTRLPQDIIDREEKVQ